MKVLKVVAIILYVLLCIICLIALYFCISTVLTTFVIYSLLALLSVGVLRFLHKSSILSRHRYLNIKTAILSLILTLFVGELALRYIGVHQTYPEKNGSFIYYSPFQFSRLKCLNKKLVHGIDCRYVTPPPNTSHLITNLQYQYNHSYNELGLRDDSMKTKNVESTYTIIGLGDSFTEGEGTHHDSTWLRQLGQRLHKVQGQKVSTINAGVMGADPIDGYVLFSEVLINYDPELVILSINSTDIEDLIVKGGISRIDNPTQIIEGPWWEYIYSFSYIFRVAFHIKYDLNSYNLTPQEHEKRKDEAIRDIATVVQKFEKLSLKNDFKLMVVVHPLYEEFLSENQEVKYLYQVISSSTNAPVIYLLDEFKDYGITADNAKEYYWITDWHHNTEGYSIWANIIEDDIKKLLPNDTLSQVVIKE